MANALFVLTTRSGQDIRNPVDEQLRRALDDLFSTPPPPPGADCPSAWLRYEQAAGTMLVLEVRQDGAVLFDQWADVNYARELFPPQRLDGVTPAQALALWRALRVGDVAAVEGEDWQPD